MCWYQLRFYCYWLWCYKSCLVILVCDRVARFFSYVLASGVHTGDIYIYEHLAWQESYLHPLHQEEDRVEIIVLSDSSGQAIKCSWLCQGAFNQPLPLSALQYWEDRKWHRSIGLASLSLGQHATICRTTTRFTRKSEDIKKYSPLIVSRLYNEHRFKQSFSDANMRKEVQERLIDGFT